MDSVAMYRIGADIGGTNIAIGLLDDALEIVRRVSVPFPREGGGPRTARIIYECSMKLLRDAGAGPGALKSVGAVVPGSIDPSFSVVVNAYNLGFHGEPLKKRIEEYFPDTQVFLANDADGAALAELHKGALRGCRTAALLTLGTGLGGGIILDGKLFRGGRGNGVEPGHMLLVSGGEKCTCGNRGCAEAYCSASALIREGARAMAEYGETALRQETGGDAGRLSAKLVIDCAKAGDRAARAVFDRYVDYLGSAAASVFNILDCERIAIGGGVSAAGDFLFEPLRRNAHGKCFFANHGSIVPAVMGNDAGMTGAAMLGRERETGL